MSDTPIKEITVFELIDIIKPDHERTSCDDDHVMNGITTNDAGVHTWRCARCMLLEVARGESPKDFNAELLL